MTTAHSNSNPFSGRVETALRESEERFRLINDHAHDAIFYLDLNGQIQWASRQATVVTGRPMVELVHGSFMKLLTPQAAALAEARLASVRRGKAVPPVVEFELLRPDGSKTWVEASATSVQQDGNVIGRLVVFRDITERKGSEAQQRQLLSELAQSKAHFEKIFHATPSAIGISTVVGGRFIDVNDSLIRLTGYTREELIGHTTLELNLWADPSERARIVQEIVEHGALHNREGRLRTKSGDIRTLIVSVEQTQIGSEACLIYIAHDITERTQAEAALAKSEERYRVLYEDSPTMNFIVDADGTVLSVNRIGAECLGYTVDELIGQPVLTVFPQEEHRAVTVQLNTCLREPDRVHRWEIRKVRKDGAPLWVRETARTVWYREGLPAVMIVCEDITERKRAEEALRESEERYRTLMAHAPEAIVVLDVARGRFVQVNENAVRLFGLPREALLQTGPIELSPPTQPDGRSSREAALELIRAAVNGNTPVFEWVHRTAAGTDITCEVRLVRLPAAGLVLVRGSVTDITERKRAEAALQASEQALRTVLKEREQLAQDLHDGLIQSLYAMGMSMEECQRLAEEDPQKAKLKLGQAIADLNTVIREVRSHLAEDIHDVPFGAGKFKAELRRVASTMERASALSFRLNVYPRAAECLTAEERKEILYIAQEAMSNCLRHSGASIAQVSLRLQNEQVRLEVKDDGIGFDTKMLNGEHRGLRNMTGRAARIGAKLDIASAHPRGTCLTLDVPLKRSQGDHP